MDLFLLTKPTADPPPKPVSVWDELPEPAKPLRTAFPEYFYNASELFQHKSIERKMS